VQQPTHNTDRDLHLQVAVEKPENETLFAILQLTTAALFIITPSESLLVQVCITYKYHTNKEHSNIYIHTDLEFLAQIKNGTSK
jgi:hypothetical protein